MNLKRLCFDVAAAAIILSMIAAFVWAALVVQRHSQAVEDVPRGVTESELLVVTCLQLAPHEVRSCLRRRGVVGPHARVEVVAESTARIEARRVQVGDQVAKGDELFLLDRALAQIQLDAADAQLASARSLLSEAEAELESARDLDDDDLINQTKARRDAAEASVRLADTRRAEAALAQQQCVVTAPIAGVIAQCFLDVGEYAADGRPVAEIVSVDPVHVTVSLTARELDEIGRSLASWQVTMEKDKTIDAKVMFTAPVADPVTKRFSQVLEVANPTGQLMIGAKIDVLCNWQQQEATLTMPRRAIILRENGLVCYRIETDGQRHICRETPVRISSIPGVPETVRVLEGVEAGDRVATDQLLHLRDGREVQIAQ